MTLRIMRVSSRPSATSSRLRRAMLSPPLVDQIGDQAAPAGLVAGSQAHSAVAVVVLVEEQIVLPVRVVLKFLVGTETWALAVGAAFEDCDHAIGGFLCHIVRRNGLTLTGCGQ